jgi:hypothetical protein
MMDAIVVQAIDRTVLIKSKRAPCGFKGVVQDRGRYKAKCNTAPCRHHNLGSVGTPEEAAQAYLQHCQTFHSEALEKEQQRAPRSDPLLSSGGRPQSLNQSLKRLAGWADMQQLLKNSKIITNT